MDGARKPGEAAALVMAKVAEAPGSGVMLIATWTGLSPRQVSDAAAQLIARGWVERTGVGFYKATEAGRTALAEGETVTSGPNGPTGATRRLQDTFRVRAWRSMRIRRAFSAAEVAMDAARDEADPVEDARRYIAQLVRAGYLVGSASRVGRTFRLIRDTGPNAPIWSRVRGEMQDDNLCQAEARRGRS